MLKNDIIFDRREYSESLKHIGAPYEYRAFNLTLLRRAIPGEKSEDMFGPWPYASAPSNSALKVIIPTLGNEKFVSLTMILRPDAKPPKYDCGVDVVPLKEHYVLDPNLPAPTLRPKTRRNLSIAERHWSIEPLQRNQIATVCIELHRLLVARRNMSDFAKVSEDHFRVLAGLEGIEAMAAYDEHGPGAVLIAARTDTQTDLLHLLTSPRIIPTCGTYLLMLTALQRWSQDGCVYLGGAPASKEGSGIAQFKARWANRTTPAFLLKAVLDHDRYRALSGGRSQSAFFPAYREASA